MPPGEGNNDAGPLSVLNDFFTPHRVKENSKLYHDALAASSSASLRERAEQLGLFAGVDPAVSARYLAWFDQSAFWTDEAVDALLELLRNAVTERLSVTFVFIDLGESDEANPLPVSVVGAVFPDDPMHIVISAQHAA